MFEKASRMKLRFNYKGLCSVEDLWDITVQGLDKVFKELNMQLKSHSEESLLNKKSKAESVLEMKIDIVRYIVEVKIKEQKLREEKISKASQKQKILSIIAEKQDAELYNKSTEELSKLVEEL